MDSTIKRIMKKHLALLLILLSYLQIALAQYTISGEVVNNQGTAIADVEVMLNTSITSTNKKGKFSFTDIKPGQYQLNIFHEDFDNKFIGVKVTDKDVNIPVTLDSIHIEHLTLDIGH